MTNTGSYNKREMMLKARQLMWMLTCSTNV